MTWHFEWLRAAHIASGAHCERAGLSVGVVLFCFAVLMNARVKQTNDAEVARTLDDTLEFLRKVVLSHAMHAAWAAGISLSWLNWSHLSVQLWYWVKIALVTLITIAHWRLTVIYRLLSKPVDNHPDGNDERRLHALIVLIPALLIGIVVFVVVEPWS